MRKYLPIIKMCELFDGIDDNILADVLTCLNAEVKSFRKGDTVCRAGEFTNSAGVVLTGRIYLESNDFLGNKSIVTEFTPGRCFGESYAFAKNMTMPFNIVAKENSDILVFDMRRLAAPCVKDCMNHRLLTDNLLCSMAAKHCELNNKITHLSRRTTREKLISYLSEQANLQKTIIFTIPFNRQQLADFLSVDRSAMSNELCKMRDEGMIVFDKNNFQFQ
jgi:CRP-like cAMP-binding protein